MSSSTATWFDMIAPLAANSRSATAACARRESAGTFTPHLASLRAADCRLSASCVNNSAIGVLSNARVISRVTANLKG